jgi:hypothetical protein
MREGEAAARRKVRSKPLGSAGRCAARALLHDGRRPRLGVNGVAPSAERRKEYAADAQSPNSWREGHAAPEVLADTAAENIRDASQESQRRPRNGASPREADTRR